MKRKQNELHKAAATHASRPAQGGKRRLTLGVGAGGAGCGRRRGVGWRAAEAFGGARAGTGKAEAGAPGIMRGCARAKRGGMGREGVLF